MQIRQGRDEDGSLEWKTGFWNLKKDEGRREFLKDITAMANSTDSTDMRCIILGVKGSKLISCQLPEDEANLQQRLSAITPLPTVRFEKHDIGGVSLVVVEIHPPFDRPYVAKIASQYFIWVRHGSSTGTASRFHLDSVYRDRVPKPSLFLTWLDEHGEGTRVFDLPSPPPFEQVAVEAELRRIRPKGGEIDLVHKHEGALLAAIRRFGPGRLGFGRRVTEPREILKWPEELAEDIDLTLSALAADPLELAFRYQQASRARQFSLELHNDGTAPAEGVVVSLYSSQRARILNLERYVRERLPVPEARVLKVRGLIALAGELEEDASALDRLDDGGGLCYNSFPQVDLLPPLPLHPAMQPALNHSYDSGNLHIELRDALSHNFSTSLARRVGSTFGFIVGTLEPGEAGEVEYSIHADNLPESCYGSLRVSGEG
ncbi:MAG: ATP-binding protein [Deltaproteobacteria bacterium]|nr:ATP-binding protein [Deltaproteobacteria bacterium]